MRLQIRWIACAFVLLIAAVAHAELKPETVLDELNNPCGVTVQPGTGHVFVADSGAGRVVRVVDGKAQDVITGFPKDVYGKGPMYDIGPLGLLFLDQNTLVVGGGGKPDGEEILRVYKVPEAGADALEADDMLQSFTLGPEGDIKGEGNFYAMAKSDSAVYVTCNGDDTKGWISRAKISGGKLGEFERFLPTKEKVEVDAPVGITFSEEGFVVVGQMGEITVPEDGLLTFYNEEGEMKLNLEVGLSDITAVAYSTVVKPDTNSNKKQLYCLDFAWADTTQGGLFQLIADGDEGVKAVKKIALDKPTAMAFDAEGALYVTVIGTAAEGSEKPAGKLIKLGKGWESEKSE